MEAPLTPAWAEAITASSMNLPGSTAAARSGDIVKILRHLLGVLVQPFEIEALADYGPQGG